MQQAVDGFSQLRCFQDYSNTLAMIYRSILGTLQNKRHFPKVHCATRQLRERTTKINRSQYLNQARYFRHRWFECESPEPSHCIGHGACKSACPTDAIMLVLGNEKRGIDIPLLNPNFETNVPGLFIAGELGGMGLISNTIEQGRQAMENVRSLVGESSSDVPYDIVIIGAGPAGFSSTLYAHEHKLRYVTLEQEDLGGTVSHFPRGKIVMTRPVQLPIIGQVKFTETTKETLIDFWKKAEQRSGIKINYQERMDSVEKTNDGFLVKTPTAEYHTKSLLLARSATRHFIQAGKRILQLQL